jgi:hypothetical protein
MPVNAPRAALPAQPVGPEAALAGCSEPAWVIDAARGRVLAANPAGAARLGLRPDAASGTLDASMPGLIRLRALARKQLASARREALVFWTAYGAEKLLCDIAALEDATANGEGEQPLLLVSIARREPRKPAAAPDAPRQPEKTELDVAGEPVSLPSVEATSEDAATLKKIASAIRGGFAGGGNQQPAAEPDDDDPEADGAETSPPQVSKLAHELRTPLSAIAAAAELMKDQRFGNIGNERYLGYTADIHENARHALALINRLLGDGADDDEIARSLQPEELDLNTLSEGVVSSIRPLAEAASVDLSNEFHARLPHVSADATAVRQILFNLLSNAIRHTPGGGNVRVVTGLGFDRSVFVAVQDTGSGMSAETIKAALSAPVPPHPQRKQEGGHGIGLPLARSLAEANGATLEIDSAPKEGTAAALVFPRERVIVRSDEA